MCNLRLKIQLLIEHKFISPEKRYLILKQRIEN